MEFKNSDDKRKNNNRTSQTPHGWGDENQPDTVCAQAQGMFLLR
jgi:hypothetical protein